MKNILLLFLGIFIALASLEILLQTSSFVIAQADKFTNRRAGALSRDKNVIKILCIGESTTFAQYPKQLTDYLNANLKKDFMVIDCGIPGTNIKNITERIDSQLEMYNPDIVISMMGINDASLEDKTVYKRYKLKTVSLFMLIKRNIEEIAARKLHADDSTGDYTKISDESFRQNREPSELIKLAEKNPHDLKVIESLIYFYRMKQNFNQVENYAGIFFKNGGTLEHTSVLFMLTDVYVKQQKHDKAKELILSVLKDKKITDDLKDDYLKKTVESYLSFSDLQHQSDFYNLITAEKAETSILDDLYQYLVSKNINAVYYNYPNKFKNLNKALTLNTEQIRQAYLVFAKKAIDHGAVYICMGYPTMPISEVEIFFKNSPLKNDIIFVSNENNFKERLKKEPYYKFFNDSFGLTFGHCTKLGNAMIAENVGKKITELIN